jgi:hypothetical protein
VPEKGRYFVGTPAYASISAHESKNPSFRDDLECLAYSMLALYTRENGFWFNFNTTYHKWFIKAKLSFINSPSVDPRLKSI